MSGKAQKLELQPWQRPPFEPGNQLAVTHGAYSLDLVNKTAEELWGVVLEMLMALPGWNDADQLVVAEFRITTAQLHQLRTRTKELGGLLDDENRPRPYWPLEDKLARRWLDQAKALGLGAAERAKVFGNLGTAERAHTQAMRDLASLQEDFGKKPTRKRKSS